MQNTWLVLVPPLLVMILSFATHRVALSVILGIISAALIFQDFSLLPTLKTSLVRLWETTELGNFFSWNGYTQGTALPINLSLLALGILIELMRHAGGTKAYCNYVQKKIHTAKGAQNASIFLSFVFFVDDYLNILTVGTVMHSLTDSFKIARAKLAFLVNALASPLCLLIPISSWGGIILGGINKSGINNNATAGTIVSGSAFTVYVTSLPFLFYTFIMICSVIFIVQRKISFGAMHTHETIAEQTHNLYGGKGPHRVPTAPEETQNHPEFIDFLLPISVLVLSIFGLNFIAKTNMPFALFIGSSLTLLITLPFYLAHKKINPKKLYDICKDGINLMLPSICVITLAWAFGTILIDDLHTGDYLKNHVTHILNINYFPLIFFLVSTFTRLAIGSSWVTITLLLPIAIPLLASLSGMPTPIPTAQIQMLFPTIGAILCGAAAGTHLSPISDNVIMASTSTGAYLMDHVKTMQGYIIPIYIATCISFLLSGLLIHYSLIINVSVSLGSGLMIALSLLSFFNYRRKLKENK